MGLFRSKVKGSSGFLQLPSLMAHPAYPTNPPMNPPMPTPAATGQREWSEDWPPAGKDRIKKGTARASVSRAFQDAPLVRASLEPFHSQFLFYFMFYFRLFLALVALPLFVLSFPTISFFPGSFTWEWQYRSTAAEEEAATWPQPGNCPSSSLLVLLSPSDSTITHTLPDLDY